MCLIIAIPRKQTVPDWVLNNGWSMNKDGAGIMYVDDNGKVGIYKTLESPAVLIRAYHTIRQKFPKSNIIVHFRQATHGVRDLTNCHPFLVDENLGFCHNGIFRGLEDKVYSDTYIFNEDYLKKLPKGFHLNSVLMMMMKEFVGSYNKLCFLDSKNNVVIVNRKEGTEQFGCWFSNTTYRFSGWLDYYDTKKCESANWVDKKYKGKKAKKARKVKLNSKPLLLAQTLTAVKNTLAKSVSKNDDECSECGNVLRSELEFRWHTCVDCLEEQDYVLGQNGTVKYH